MCNALNHSLGCLCGWGGDGHKGKRARGARHSPLASSSNFSFKSFTDPHASCPDCRQRVFFYHSTSGGRVYFDELGPPWPKHACTDTSGTPVTFQAHSSDNSRSGVGTQGRKDGWTRIKLRYEQEIDKRFTRFHVILHEKEQILYLRKSDLWRHERKATIQQKVPAYVREISNGIFQLSMLNRAARPIRLHCYTSHILAVERG